MALSVQQLQGVVDADLNFASGILAVEYEVGVDQRERVRAVVRASGLGIEPLIAPSARQQSTAEARGAWWTARRQTVGTIVCGLLMLLGWTAGRAAEPAADVWSVAAYVGAIAIGGAVVFRRALTSIRVRSFDMNLLMTIAVLGAAAIGEWAEGATVVFLFSVGRLLETLSLARTRRSIRELMELSPSVAHVVRHGVEVDTPVAGVVPGDVVAVRPGERVPVDGSVVAGHSAVDESPITGESTPVDKSTGDGVFAGSLNTSGRLEVRATAPAAESMLSRIVHLVEEAQASRAPTQRLVDRFSRHYTPVVVALAVAVAVVPPVLGAMLGATWGGFEEWFYRALVVLVVSCPCALVISTPVSIVSAITRASRDGVLVKGGAHLETASRIRVVALDKTGTLTSGTPEVTDLVPIVDDDGAGLLARAADLAAHSNHPVARAVVRASEGRVVRSAVTAFEDVPGGGVRGAIGGVAYTLGSPAFVGSSGHLADATRETIAELEATGRTVLVLARGGLPIGVIGIADTVRPESRRAVEGLMDVGMRHVVMLTGDNERTAAAVAGHAGITEYRARLLPRDKVDAVTALREEFGLVSMVGDGVNDAPALAASDLGIAMGAAGSDTAVETADVALMSDDLTQLPRFFSLGRRTVAIVWQNIVLSVAVKFAVLALAVTGSATLWMAVFADTGMSLLVTLNGMRLLIPARTTQESRSGG
ncbi:MAG TPA: cation-translocating P-type ATPase [Coriobacteriia bacterium]|nr:cation-translocating P-type ATPase [Coriobacteriia bacterium]